MYLLKSPTSRLARIRLDLEEYDYTVKHISGKDSVVADALSRIEIEDLKNIYEEYPIFKFEHTKFSEIKSKHEPKNLKTNQILAITRSMTKNTYNTQNSPQNEEQNTSSNVKVIETTNGFNNKISRIRMINTKHSQNGRNDLIQATLAISHKHRKVCTFTIMNEKLSLTMILSQIEHEAKTHNIKLLQWPLHDKIFTMCTIDNFKTIANNKLKSLKLLVLLLMKQKSKHYCTNITLTKYLEVTADRKSYTQN